ncbi:unnamed protein product [Ectocarpus sp. 6 AP-2014]
MGLTTSSEAIGRHMNQVSADATEDQADSHLPSSNGVPVAKEAERVDSSTTMAVSAPSETARKRKCEQDEDRPTVQQKAKKRKIKTGSKRASSKKAKPVKKATTVQHGVQEGELLEGSTTVGLKGTAKINPHRAKILVGKQALAAIKEGTRIFIKSGEGNGGDTWWDSGIVQKIHERGKPYEVEWQKMNNRGEEVDTDVERRIILPVTYSLAGVAAEAIKGVELGTEAAASVMKNVLAKARLGSWCISHPKEPWGMLDPFGQDSTPNPVSEVTRPPVELSETSS